MTTQRFLFTGQPSYRNRGCEAIVRGTTALLDERFDRPQYTIISFYHRLAEARRQAARERHPRVRLLPFYAQQRRFDEIWWLRQWDGIRRTGRGGRRQYSFLYHHLMHQVRRATAVLAIGGDNYSLYYGFPKTNLHIDRFVRRAGKPHVIWGASVGPFGDDPDVVGTMADHLRRVDGIYVREKISKDYLATIGVESNVHHVADPAFLMPPEQAVETGWMKPGTVGLNLSPLIGTYPRSDGRSWEDVARETILAVRDRLDRPILLIPHVTEPTTDDHQFMREVLHGMRDRRGVLLLGRHLTAAQLKDVIAHCHVFIGARSHATIAALSSAVPTVCLSYSIKSRGINHDIFGHEDFCVDTKTASPAEVADAAKRVCDDREAIHRQLAARMPHMRRQARLAGALLADLLAHRPAGR